MLSRSVSDLWYKDAVIYNLDVKSYMDGNGDGIGDFVGLTSRLNYIAGLGVTCIWLGPFYPSPKQDNGYDISDYYGVDPQLGSLGDFVDFLRQARNRGMRVIIDLVPNHTSDQHRWFQEARADRESPFRDFYVWRDEPPEKQEPNVFPGREDSTWDYDEAAGQYYWHRFYSFEPELNPANPAVREELRKVIGFWLELGISGFRVDAVPFLIESVDGSIMMHPESFLWEMCSFVRSRSGDAMLLAEANVPPSELPRYFSDGNGMQMLFNFVVMNYTFGALARADAALLADGLAITPAIPGVSQWGSFLRNHDELDLSRLPESVQADVFAAFAPEEAMQLYGRGIRRRLAPMLGGDQRRLEMAYSLMFTMPGTPVIWYGDEIGMGEDLSLQERESIRTPMQWEDAPNGGFSAAPPDKLYRPVGTEGAFAYEAVNAYDQQRDPESLLNWVERAIRNRKQHLAFGRGVADVIGAGNPHVFAHKIDWEDDHLILLHNLSKDACPVTLEADPETLRQVFGNRPYDWPVPKRGRGARKAQEKPQAQFELDGYGYVWLSVRQPVE